MSSIKVILNGGLGNQLFQYAYGRKLALLYGIDLFLDISLFSQDVAYQRKFSLDQYSLPSNIKITNNKRYANFCWNLFKLSHRKLLPQYVFDKIGIYEYDPKDSKVRSLSIFSETTPVVGYWQNAALFSDCREILLNDLIPKDKLSDRNDRLRIDIENSCDSVALHLRCNRNHMVKTYTVSDHSSFNPDNKYSFVLPVDYYANALIAVTEQVSNPTIYVFSDNIDWSKHVLKGLDYNFIYLEEKRGEDWEDIFLMSKCRHHIIANSSFSWWGAWLSSFSGVKVSPYNVPYTPMVPLNWLPIYVKN